MTWVHMQANGGMGIEEQHLLRWHGKPVCSLKQDLAGRNIWKASLLNLDGYGAAMLVTTGTEEMAKAEVEATLVDMGWSRPEPTAHPRPFSKTERGRDRRNEKFFKREMRERHLGEGD